MNELTDWDDFFDSFSANLRRGLLVKFGLSGSASIERALLSLPPEVLEKLDRFRADVVALSQPDSKALETVLDSEADLELDGLEGSIEAATWLYLHKPALFDSALELLQFDRGMNRPAMWTGFQIDAAFQTASLGPEGPTLLAELSKSFATKILPTPQVRVLSFARTSGRSDSRALMMTISVEGPPQHHRIYKKVRGRKRPVTEYFSPERGAAVLVDDKARTIDVVSSEMSATLRKTIVRIVLKHLGVPDSKMVRLQPQWVNVESLAARRSLNVDPEQDGILRVRLVGARMSRPSGSIVTLDAREADAADAWEAWRIWGRSKPGTFGTAEMLGATLEFVFPDSALSSGERVRSLRLHKPFGLTMQNWPKTNQNAAVKVLERWGLLRTGPSA